MSTEILAAVTVEPAIVIVPDTFEVRPTAVLLTKDNSSFTRYPAWLPEVTFHDPGHGVTAGVARPVVAPDPAVEAVAPAVVVVTTASFRVRRAFGGPR